MDNYEEGIRVDGIYINNIRFAEDAVILVDSDLTLQILLDEINNASEKFGMELNVKKTKITAITKKQNLMLPIMLNGQVIE